jgi:hypothetical protein
VADPDLQAIRDQCLSILRGYHGTPSVTKTKPILKGVHKTEG